MGEKAILVTGDGEANDDGDGDTAGAVGSNIGGVRIGCAGDVVTLAARSGTEESDDIV